MNFKNKNIYNFCNSFNVQVLIAFAYAFLVILNDDYLTAFRQNRKKIKKKKRKNRLYVYFGDNVFSITKNN